MIFDRNENKALIALLGAGSMGTAIVRRIATGKKILLGDISEQNLEKPPMISATADMTLRPALSTRWKKPPLRLLPGKPPRLEKSRFLLTRRALPRIRRSRSTSSTLT